MSLPKYKSLGAKIVAHEEHLANKRIPVDPIMEEDIKKGVLALEALLKVADCPNCDGSMTIPFQDGNGDWDAEPCQWCFERHALLEEYQGY